MTRCKAAPAVPFLRATFPEGLPAALQQVFESGFVGAGDRVQAFEVALAEYLGVPSIVATSSCTAALTLAYTFAGIHPDSPVLSTPMTCAATNMPLLQMGARVNWLDVDPLSGNATADSVAIGLERHPEARTVVIMDWGGVPCDYDGIGRVCQKAEATLILDAAQSFGSSLEGRLLPREVDSVCYSFGPTKLLSSVEGGAIAVRDRSDDLRLRALRWYGIQRDPAAVWRFWEYTVRELGYRAISNDIFATIGLAMLTRIEERLSIHRALAKTYDNLLAGIPGLRLAARPAGSEPNFWLYTLLVEQRDALLEKLHEHGFHAATPHRRNDHLLAKWCPTRSGCDLVGVDYFDKSYICLPIGPWVTQSDVLRLCAVVRSGW